MHGIWLAGDHPYDFSNQGPSAKHINQDLFSSMKTHFDDSVKSGHADEILWTARKLRPQIPIYVVLIFVFFMLISLFIFHSMSAFRSLALAAIASIVALLPLVLGKFEYQADGSGVRKRPFGNKNKKEFEKVFNWSELSHASVLKHGFKYFKTLDEQKPVQRFLKIQFSDRYSGEIHVGKEDQDRVLGLFTDHGVPIRHR